MNIHIFIQISKYFFLLLRHITRCNISIIRKSGQKQKDPGHATRVFYIIQKAKKPFCILYSNIWILIHCILRVEVRPSAHPSIALARESSYISNFVEP